MRRELVLLSLISVLALGSVVQAANIIWVSDNKGYGSVEPNTPGDQGWIDLLTAQGHNVIYKNQYEYIDGQQYWRTLDPNKIAELEAADLVILSRNADSGSYSTAADNEPNLWNAVTTPLISLSAHMSRVGKWGWLNGTGTTYALPPKFNVVDPSHAVFAGVAIDPNGQVAALNPQWNVDWVTGVTDAGNGKVLATRAGDGLVSIVTWEAGQKFFDAGVFTAGGPRMLFIAGTGSKNAGDNYAPDGLYNLTPDGEKMFVNAVNFMLNKGKAIVWVSAMYPSTDDANVPGDQGFVDLLRAAGYDVDYMPGSQVGTGWVSYWETLDPNKLAVLDAADLVIVARACNSAGMASDATELAAWDNVQTPVMLMSSYIAANNRWKWIDSSSQDARKTYYDLKAVDPSHPLFAGVALDPNGVVQWYDPNVASGYASFINSADAGNGEILAVRPDNGNMLIAVWAPGKPFYATSTQTPVDTRMFFSAGTQEISGQKTNWGVMNLNADGQKIFLNAVEYMMRPQKVEVSVGTAADTWLAASEPNAQGTLDFMVIHGGNADRTGYVRFDLSSLNIQSIESATLTLFVHGSIPKPPYRNDSCVTGRFALYGLNNVAGNTPQDWDEAVLTSASTGTEMDWAAGAVVTAGGLAVDLDDDVAGITETVSPTSSPGNASLGATITITGDALVSFLQSRVDDDGLVTFILKDDDGSDRGYGLCTKEFADEAYRPKLTLTAFVK
jgi:hypothetical protein